MSLLRLHPRKHGHLKFKQKLAEPTLIDFRHEPGKAKAFSNEPAKAIVNKLVHKASNGKSMFKTQLAKNEPRKANEYINEPRKATAICHEPAKAILEQFIHEPRKAKTHTWKQCTSNKAPSFWR